MPRRDLKDMTGMRFGDRTAVEYVGRKMWKTVCKCGLEFIVQGGNLRSRSYCCRHVLADRFWSKVEKTDGCWNWTGALNGDGYGSFRVGAGTVKAHGFTWELANGPVPAGLELDHVCRNRACVRPDHLEAVTHIVNVHRGNMPSIVAARGFAV